MDRRVDFLIGQMKCDMRRSLSAVAMAGMVNLSTSHLTHLFRREAQMSPRHFVKRVRMQHARHLLETSFMSVKEVMASSGFNDASHFARDFKQLYGKTPGQYRRDFKGDRQTQADSLCQQIAEIAN